MKRVFSYLCLFILPILLYVLEVIYSNAKGEYFLWCNYDGPYDLLFSSLNIVHLQKPGFFQHPGIVPELIAAGIIKFTHLFTGKAADIDTDVFDRAEYYLQSINLIFTLITVLCVLILGVVAYRKTGSLPAAFFLQFTPFTSVMVLLQLTQNTCETSTMIVSILLIALTMSFIYEQTPSKRKILFYTIAFGIVCGIGIANKISNLPLMILPFLLIRKFSYKSLFILIAVITFSFLFLFTPDRPLFFKILLNNLTGKASYYSAGPSNFSDPAQILSQLQYIFKESLLFCIVCILIIAVVIIQFIPKFKNQIRSNKFFLPLIAVMIINVAFGSLLIKSHIGHYVLPALMFSVFGLFAVNEIFSELFPKVFRFGKYSFLYLAFILITIPQISIFKNTVNLHTFRRNESYKIINYTKENYADKLIVGTNLISSQPAAFYESLLFTGPRKMEYFEVIKERYPDFVYYQRWAKKFLYLNFNPELMDRFVNSEKFIYHSFNDASFKDFKEKLIELTNKKNTTFEEVFSNKLNEKLYLVTQKD